MARARHSARSGSARIDFAPVTRAGDMHLQFYRQHAYVPPVAACSRLHADEHRQFLMRTLTFRPSATAARLIVERVTDGSSRFSRRWTTARLVRMRRASSD